MDEQPSPSYPTFRCLICLNDCLPSERATVLSCKHGVCTDCLRSMWTHSIMTNSEPFPRCPEPGCPTCGSDAAVSALVTPRALQRMRQLRNLKPTRTTDGRRLFCTAQDCHEPLPPPPPPSPPPQTAGPPREQLVRDEEETEQGGKSPVTVCPDCGQSTCMQCGEQAHPSRLCVMPVLDPRERRLYNEYAVGRIAACPRCGVHTVNDEGCSSVKCGRCHFMFDFQPFRTYEEAEEAALLADVLQGTARERPFDAAEISFAGIFLVMVWGAGYSAVPLAAFVEILLRDGMKWILLIFLPFICMGVPVFVASWIFHICCCALMLLQVLDRRPSLNSIPLAIGRSVLGVCIFCFGMVPKYFLQDIEGSIRLWQWLFYILPFFVCGVSLTLVAVTNAVVVAAQACLGEPDGRDHVLSDNNSDVGNEDGYASLV